jgi:hypothetical protein
MLEEALILQTHARNIKKELKKKTFIMPLGVSKFASLDRISISVLIR